MANTTNFGWETPDDTDLVKDGAAAMRTLGNAIDTSFVDLKGGTTGQNLRKNSNTDLDFTWAGDATNTVIDAEGDLLVGDSADTLQRLALGSNGQVLTVDTAVDGKIKWATGSAADSMTLLSTTAITATNSITVSNISTAYTRLIVFVENFALNTTGNVQMRFNSDTGSNYSGSSVQSQQGVVHPTGTQTNFGTVGFGNLAATNNASFIVDIPFYAGTAAYKNGTFQISGTYGGTSDPVSFSGGIAYRSTSAITSITLMSAGEQLIAQGNIKIYGVK